MGGDAAVPAKICRVCNTDCSARPRQKDAQGRYICQDCLNKAKEKQAGKAAGAAPSGKPGKPGAPDADLDPGLAAALAGVDQGALTPCPNCAVLLKPDAVLCTSCGYNLEKGKSVKTKFTVEKEAREKGDFKLPISWEIVAGIMVFLIVGTGIYAAVLPSGVIAFWIALGLCNLLIWLMMIVVPFQDGRSGWGLYNLVGPLYFPAMLITGRASCYGLLMFGAYPFVAIYYIFFVNWRPSLKRLFWASFIGGIMLSILFTMHGPDRILESIGVDPNSIKGDDEKRPRRTAPADDEDSGTDQAPAKGGVRGPG